MASTLTPIADADFTGGDFVNLSAGVNYISNANNWTNGHRLSFEYTQPVLQDLAGV